MTKLSIIIPVFNAEKYLNRCVNSVLNAIKVANHSAESTKSSDDFEILVVDNNSTDNSLSVLTEFAKEHPGVISVLQCHTPGAAAARNYGTKRAKGEYIWYIDADDQIDKSSIELLLDKAQETDADLVMMGAERIYPDGRKNILLPVSSAEYKYKSRFVRYGMGPWQVIIRRKWWNKYGFKFKEGFIHEDMELMSALILYTDKLASVDKPLYFYYQNDNSVLHKKEFDPHIFDIFPVLESLYQRFVDVGAEKEYHDELEWFFIWNLLIDSANDFRRFPEGKSGFAHSREMLKKYFPGWRKNRFLRQKPLKLQILTKSNYYR